MYKAVFVDIDGTLVDAKKNISEETKLVLKNARDNGIEVVLCSGRCRRSVQDLRKVCSVSRYVISANGAEIYDCETEEVLYQCALESEICQRLWEMAMQKNMLIKLDFGLGRIINQTERMRYYEMELQEDICTFLNKNAIRQISLSSEHDAQIEEAKKQIAQNPNNAIVNEFFEHHNGKKFHYIHCANKNVSKGNAMTGLCKYLKIDLKNVVAIGDDINDISMIKMAGLGVAMGNSSDEIKEIADKITTTNEENGVARVLEKLLEEK